MLWEQVRDGSEPFSAIIAWSATRFNLAQGGEARYAEGQYVSGDFFRVLGVQPLDGPHLHAPRTIGPVAALRAP